jgi:hypothetical protein
MKMEDIKNELLEALKQLREINSKLDEMLHEGNTDEQ